MVSTPPETTAGHESRSPGLAEAARTFDQVAEADGSVAVAARAGSVLILIDFNLGFVSYFQCAERGRGGGERERKKRRRELWRRRERARTKRGKKR